MHIPDGNTGQCKYAYRTRLADLYEHLELGCDGVVAVPVLYDKEQDLIVNKESSEIIRMLHA